MRLRLFLLVMLLGVVAFAGSPAWEMAEHFRTLERAEVSASRKVRLQKWMGEKRPLTALVDFSQEEKSRETEQSRIVVGEGMILAVDKKSGLPQWLSFDGGGNLLANHACLCPLWELRLIDAAGQVQFIGSYDSMVECRELDSPLGMEITYTRAEAVAKVTIRKAAGAFVRFGIMVDNCGEKLRFDRLEFPRLALLPRGTVASNKCVLPWRRGRLRPIDEFQNCQHEEYPCSSARFQMTALYDAEKKKGIYFASEDAEGHEKEFLQTYVPAYGMFIKNLRCYPADRGRPGNAVKSSFTCLLGTFDGDWFDAGQIYRQWYLQQHWVSRGPLYRNDTPEFLKHAPVWLRFYLRESKKLFPESVLNSFNRWCELFPNQKIPATLYHYAKFREPENKPNYPVCEYYGFCAAPFPGLPEILQDCTSRGLRCSVFLQSEIYNQDAPENMELAPGRKLTSDGTVLLYLNERGICCRMSPVWQKRSEEMREHLIKIGFTGFYQDTFGKSKPASECFDIRHGHGAGGANTDYRAQRSFGEASRKQTKAVNPEFYLGGEASCECYVDLLDYKLNAVSTYPGHIPLERALYGDYILSHGRVVSEEYTASDFRQIGFDFLEGVIPGRFFGLPPEDEASRKYLKDMVGLTEAAYDYLRVGRMIRPMEFAKPVAMMELMKPQKMKTEEWRNTVYRSYKDGSVGIAVFRFGEGQGENSLILPSAADLEVPKQSTIWRLMPDGKRMKLGSMETQKEIFLNLPGNGFDFFIIQ
jgi:hypothetical protein